MQCGGGRVYTQSRVWSLVIIGHFYKYPRKLCGQLGPNHIGSTEPLLGPAREFQIFHPNLLSSSACFKYLDVKVLTAA